AMKAQPPAQQPWLVMLAKPDDLSSEQVDLDPNKLDAKGKIAIDFVESSLDGKKIAVSLSENGSEEGTLYFYDVESGKQIGEKIPHINGPTAGGSVAWNAQGSGVYYTRYPHKGERPDEDLDFYQQVWFHQLGRPVEEDRYELGRELPRIAEIELNTSRDGRYVVASVSNGDGGDYAFYLHGPEGKWKQVARFEGDELLFKQTSYVNPYVWSRLDGPNSQPRATGMVGTSPVSFDDVEVLREFAMSKDGTRVPMNIIRRKGAKLDGKNPTMLTAYGGYGASLSPSFDLGMRVWLDQGGVTVIANLRGGGEFGEAWHKAGNLTKKQNVFD